MSAAPCAAPVAGRSVDAARRVAPDVVPADATERPITVDQTNVSVVVGEVVVVKWLRPPVTQPSDTVTMLRHLAAAGFTEMPTFYGPFVDEASASVHAMVTAFVPGALDGWDWFVEELTAGLDGGSIERPLASAEAVGALAARMHEAFATPTDVIAEPTGTRSVSDEHDRGIALLDEALSCTAGAEGQRLASRGAQIRAAIDAPGSVGDVPVQHVHGDLHVGQMLQSDTALVVNDFDGNPIVPHAERHRRRTAMVDLAALIQSVDHVGRIVARRRPEHGAAIDRFIADAVERVERGYRTVRAECADDRVLLTALRVIQELHELVYAARSLPRWLYVPDAALQSLFPQVDS
ncbi:MAG: aglA2 [Ilumatobacteraceae bacterium]|nr:aglA2 [Ilumatobacteraceae bacterium]